MALHQDFRNAASSEGDGARTHRRRFDAVGAARVHSCSSEHMVLGELVGLRGTPSNFAHVFQAPQELRLGLLQGRQPIGARIGPLSSSSNTIAHCRDRRGLVDAANLTRRYRLCNQAGPC